tara:strand:- start:1019 stop:1807 length:789 start_codon:yes stop_codon:yes gene_type:complete
MNDFKPGTVYLVGAGPGDPELLTVKAKRLLIECTALVYDSLIPQELLELVSSSCECHFVGKRRGHHSFPQVKTNKLLVEMAKIHSCIVRLKGGDPFLFGRGAEEAAYLVERGIPCEVVPGITAGIAVPAYQGIPVTHRRAGSSVTFVTGHEGVNKLRPAVNWRALAQATDTLVIYMGIHNLEFISKELIEGGLDPNTPVVAIQQGTVAGQRFLKSTIDSICQALSENVFFSPSIILVGLTVNYQVEACSPLPANVTMPITFN